MIKLNLKATLHIARPKKEVHEKKGIVGTKQEINVDTLYPVRIRMTIKRVVTFAPAGFYLRKDQLLNGEVVNHPNKTLLNTVIRNKMNIIEKEKLEQEITGEAVTQKKKNLTLTFSEYAKIHIAKKKQAKKSTKDHKDSYLNKFNEFNSKIKLKDVNKDVLHQFEIFCEKRENINNTVWSAVKFVKTIMNSAVADKILLESPLKGFDGVKYIDPMRETLSDEEIIKFEEFADNKLNSEKLRNVASWFIFSCYTGLRYSDMKSFKGFANGRILIKTVKTSELVSMLATDNILQAYARIENKILSNQRMNDYLKIIAGGLEIDKDMTCHIGRHTFAVKYLRLGGRMEVLQKLLGHKTIKTTSIYGKIANVTADEELQRIWGSKKPPM